MSHKDLDTTISAVKNGAMIVFCLLLFMIFASLLLVFLYAFIITPAVNFLNSIDFKDPIVKKVVGALIGLNITSIGIVVTVLIRRFFLAQEMARNLELLEAHRIAILKNMNNIMPNAVFPADFKDISRFVSTEASLKVISLARICENVYNFSLDENTQKTEVIENYLKNPVMNNSISKISKNLKNLLYILASLSNKSRLTEGEMFDDRLV